MNNQRERFEKAMQQCGRPRLMRSCFYSEDMDAYVEKSDPECIDEDVDRLYSLFCEGWQAATEQGVGEPVHLCHQCEKEIGPPSPFKMYCWCTDCHVNTAATIARDLGNNRKPIGGGVPECPYPCGWRELHSIITRKAAYFARATSGDEVWDDQARSAGIDLGIYAREICSLLATQQPEQE